MNIVSESSEDTYVSTNLSNSLTEPKYRDGIIYMYAMFYVTMALVPSFQIPCSILHAILARAK